MAETTQQLKGKIANSKRKLTNFAKYVDGYIAERDSPSLEKRMRDVDREFIEFGKCCSELEALVDDPHLADTCTEYEEMYYTAYGKATAFMKEISSPTSYLTEAIPSTSFQGLYRESSTGTAQLPKRCLPRINLPSFSGSYESWLGFHDLFKSLVDDDKEIPDIEKLYYLKGCLKDDAAEILASIELSAENYKVAWGLLKERYDNRKIIRQTHVKALLNLKHISKDFPVRSLLDQVQKHIRALEALKEPVNHWDTLLIEIISQKLSNVLREKWEDSSCESTNPTLQELLTFLQRRAQFEEVKSYQDIIGTQNLSEKRAPQAQTKHRSQHAFSSIVKLPCPHCKGKHSIYDCEAFRKLSPSARFESGKTANLCINCLRLNHRVVDCTGAPCRKCQKKHNILLHFEKKPAEMTRVVEPATSQSVVNLHAHVSSEGLLATALVDIVNGEGESKTCRAFLDAGAQAHFITERVASFLNLPKKPVNISVSGVEDISTEIQHSVSATLKSRFNKYSKFSEFLVLKQITKPMPSITIDRASLDIPKNIVLSDPKFYEPSEIDVLIGVKLFYKLLCVGQVSLKNFPDTILQKTQLGWIVAGEINSFPSRSNIQCHLTMHSTPLDVNLVKFWELEDVPSANVWSREEQACEVHFKTHTQRDSEGRYIVRLPFNENKEKLGESRSITLHRFHSQEKLHLNELPEKRKIIASPVSIKPPLFSEEFINRYSSIKTLKRVIAHVLRFIHNLKNKSQRRIGPITLVELENATRMIVLITQSTAFAKEIHSLKINGRVNNKSRLNPLKPFVDKQGLLRVGSRLTHSELPKEQKHQILLPPDHHITRLIIREEHERLKHAGTQATLYSVREFCWPLDGRNITRMIIHKCVRCFRAKPRGIDYIMGDLPQNRVSSSRPFHNVGVDYCGPLYIKKKRFHNRNKIKVCVAIFVCMSTKAVHFELVSDLTTEAFIVCLKRLFARRGISKTIHSDNVTNFVGASKELTTLYKKFQSAEHNKTIQKFLSEQGITWNFIPPRSPHFGGLWEAAVKSFKHHLVRTVGDTLLTFEQLETCIIEIEAILNSRPLTPMSPDPNDLQPLTPSHFLIGGPLTSFPQVDFTDTAPNRLSAWQHAQKLRQDFWRRWQKEYLHQLTIRNKWQSDSTHGLQPGTMVVIKEDNLPPLQWKLGRIVATHPGPDGISRVATVKTEAGEYKCCIKKLCPLPIEPSPEEDGQTKSRSQTEQRTPKGLRSN